MRRDTKNVIAILFVILCALVLAALLTPPEVTDFLKKLFNLLTRR
jgi:hypothetical protein